MAMNTGKVVVAGLVAGIVSNVLAFLLFGMWLAPRFTADMNAAAPSLAARAEASASSGMVWQIFSGFVVGFVLAWLYAAIRPRFGPGAKTAIFAGIVVWILGFIFHLDMLLYGLTSTTTYMLATVAALIQVLGAAWVAGMLYKEEGAPAV
jgi:hypothetical protein